MTAVPGSAGPRTVALLDRVRTLEEALERGGERVAETTIRSVRASLDGVRQRLELGVDHTIVALVGGTGSGKSSVFNALSGLEFADVGVKRPTTSQVTACVWAHDASALLDWLGVARDRRIERESALDGDSQADLRGLILLDLPDHDSVEPEHRAVVDRLLPLADLLVFVVDPQKYADDALHTGYLRHLVGHEHSMLVILNQVDAVPPDARPGLLADVERLLREDGLTGVAVHGISARTGEGVTGVRRTLAQAVAGRGVAELRAAAELDDTARSLAGAVGPGEPTPGDLPAEAVDALAEAAGLPSAVVALERAVRGRGAGSAEGIGPGTVHRDRVGVVRSTWLSRIGGDLPAPWRDALDAAVADVDRLAERVDEGLAPIAAPVRGPRTATVARVVALLLGLVALGALGLAVGTLLADGSLGTGGAGPDDVAEVAGWSTTARTLALVAGGGALLAALMLLVGTALRRTVARRRARDLDLRVRGALREVVDEMLVRPTATVLDDHRVVREAALLPGDRSSTDPVPSVASTA